MGSALPRGLRSISHRTGPLLALARKKRVFAPFHSQFQAAITRYLAGDRFAMARVHGDTSRTRSRTGSYALTATD